MDSRKLGVLVLVTGAFLIAPQAAQAYGGWYCGSLKGSGNWCGWPSGAHTWRYNSAFYFGSGSIPVCQRLWDQHNNSPYGNTCGQNATERFYNPSRTWGAHVAQFSGYNHTVHGFAQTNVCDIPWYSCGTPASRRPAARLSQAGLPQGMRTRPVPQRVEPGLGERFGVLSREAAPGDVPRIGSGPALKGMFTGIFGANSALARRADVASAQSLFLIPGNDALCIAILDTDEGSVTCADLAAAADGRLIGSATREGAETVVFGALPDGVHSASIELEGGGRQPVRVADNTYAGSVTGVPTQVWFAGGPGAVARPVPFARAP